MPDTELLPEHILVAMQADMSALTSAHAGLTVAIQSIIRRGGETGHVAAALDHAERAFSEISLHVHEVTESLREQIALREAAAKERAAVEAAAEASTAKDAKVQASARRRLAKQREEEAAKRAPDTAEIGADDVADLKDVIDV